jgi:carboxyvinyl-carboxyphosphonate phosphorylmutase
MPPKALSGLASTELTGRVTREAEVNARLAQFLSHRR